MVLYNEFFIFLQREKSSVQLPYDLKFPYGSLERTNKITLPQVTI